MSWCLVHGFLLAPPCIVSLLKAFLRLSASLVRIKSLGRFLCSYLIEPLDWIMSASLVGVFCVRFFVDTLLISLFFRIDYPELEPNMSAELLSHQAQAMQRGAAPAAFAPNPGFIVPPGQPMPVPPPGLPALSNPPNIANLIGSLDGPSLSTLLSALQRPPHSQPVSATQSPFSSPNPPPADLASLLTNTHRPPPMQPTAALPHPPFNLQPVNAPVITDPNLLSLLAKGLGGQQQQGQGPTGPQVQNLMQHLAKWKQ
jgi:hypothetical protein